MQSVQHNSQVSPHDNQKVWPIRYFRLQQVRIFDRLLGRVNRAWSDNDEDSAATIRRMVAGKRICYVPIVLPGNDLSSCVTSEDDRFLGFGGSRKLVSEERRLY